MAFVEKVAEKTAVIGILGLGHVGIPLALRFAALGFRTVGFDIDEARVLCLNAGNSPIKHIPQNAIAAMRESGFEATTDFERIVEVDAIILCVPTPLNQFREPDLSFVENTMRAASPHFRAEQVLSLESATWPGTTEEVLRPHVERAGLTIGEDFYLVYSPEREDIGTPDPAPKIVGGITPACLTAGTALYGAITETVVPVSSTRTAEMVKLLESIHRAVNIGLVNEMKIVADRMGLDIFEIIDAAKTRPSGFTAYYPGPGIGGPGIPVDPFHLTWKAREYGVHTRFIELAGEMNAAMPDYVVDKLLKALNTRGKALRGAKVLVLGIAYKRDVYDTRESPSVIVMERLRDLGAEVSYNDPHIPVFPKMRDHSFDLSSVPVTPETLKTRDAVLLLTDHSEYDYDMIAANAPLLLDTRGKVRNASETVVRA